jgi:hypothetical protein
LRRVIFLFEASRWISSALFVFDKSGIKLITTAFIYNAEFTAASLYKPCKFLPLRIYFFLESLSKMLLQTSHAPLIGHSPSLIFAAIRGTEGDFPFDWRAQAD